MGQRFSLQMKNLNSGFTKTQKAAFLWIWILLMLIILYCFKDGVSGNDFWWHIKAGEWICTHKTVPKQDIFSWYGMEQHIPWTAHEWLAEVILYKIFQLGGSNGVYLFSMALGVIFLNISYLEGGKYVGRNFVFCGIFYAVYAVIVYMFFYGRPQIFSFMFLFAELKILYRFYDAPKTRSIYFIPFLSCLWSNIHGGSSCMVYVLCLIFLTAGTFEFRMGRVAAKKWDRNSRMKLAVVTITSVLALLINPIGASVLKYPYSNLSDTISMKLISEWSAPDAKDIGQLILFFLPIVLMAIGFITEEMEIRLIDLLIFAGFLYLFFRSQRFIIMWSLAANFCCMRYVPQIRIKEMTTKAEKRLMALLTAATLLLCVCTVGIIAQNIHNGVRMVKTEMSDEMLEAVKEEAITALFNEYNYSGELIFNEIPVFWDSRADLFAGNILGDASALMYLQNITGNAEDFAEKVIEKYGFDSFLLMKERPLCTYLLSHPEKYSVKYYDGQALFFIKTR